MTSNCFHLDKGNRLDNRLFYTDKNWGKLEASFRPSFMTIRTFSTTISDGSSSTDFTALAVFDDADEDKLNIYSFIKGESGIYM